MAMVMPSAAVVQAEDSPQLQDLARALQGHTIAAAQLTLDDGRSIAVPTVVAQALGPLVSYLAAGGDVSIGAFDGYTPDEAMHFLGASRSYIAGVLDRGELPYRLVDTEVRIAHADLAAHRAKLKELQREGIRLIQQLGEDDGAYDER